MSYPGQPVPQRADRHRRAQCPDRRVHPDDPRTGAPMTAPTAVMAPARPDLRMLLVFAAIALGAGGTLFALSALVEPWRPVPPRRGVLGARGTRARADPHERWNGGSPDASAAVCPAALVVVAAGCGLHASAGVVEPRDGGGWRGNRSARRPSCTTSPTWSSARWSSTWPRKRWAGPASSKAGPCSGGAPPAAASSRPCSSRSSTCRWPSPAWRTQQRP